MTNHLISILILIIVAGVIAYQASFLKNRKIFHLSLLQILYLIFLPGAVFILVNSYVQSLLILPRAHTQFIRDGILIDTIFLAMFFSYGGVAIHGVTKMLSDTGLRHDSDESAEINRYFHLTFSHNLIYGGGLLFAVCLALLELNHTSVYNAPNLISLVIRGLLIACAILFAMYSYTHSRDQYVGRWADFKAFFLIAWGGLILLYVAIKKTSPDFDSYQLLLPIFITLVVIALANIILVLRRIRRHKLYSPHRFIAFHRQKGHPAVQKSQHDLERGFQDEIEDKHQEIKP